MKKLHAMLWLVFGLLAATTALAQTQLGGVSLHHFEAHPIRSVSIGRAAGLAAIGGVAFSAVAAPSHTSDAAIQRISYSPSLPDGQRAFLVMSDGSRRTIELPDWELLTILRYVNSKNDNCVTAFGQLADSTEAAVVDPAGRGKTVNYNPALTDTLLGLRLWQADVLLMLGEAADLPTDSAGRYYLGTGEARPNLANNRAGLTALSGVLDAAEASHTPRLSYRSYVLTDLERSVTFDTSSGVLVISGEPYYRFWKYNIDGADLRAAEMAEISRLRGSLRALAPGARDGWLASQLRDIRSRLDTALEVPPAGRRPLDLTGLDTEVRAEVLVKERAYLSAVTSGVQHLTALDAVVTPRRMYDSNPALYGAAVQTMRYAAFFRYFRTSNPAGWQSLIAATANAVALPAANTPTYYVPPAPSEE